MHRGILDRVIGLDEFDRFAFAHRIGFERLGRRLGEAARDRRRAHWIDIVEKERDRHDQDPTQFVQSARADAGGAPLVFLHLLIGQADRLTELFLAQPEHVAAQPNAGADLYLDRVRFI